MASVILNRDSQPDFVFSQDPLRRCSVDLLSVTLRILISSICSLAASKE
jgi:hypothetical protein